MIRFDCAHCSNELAAPEGTEGRVTKCPYCAEPVTVPQAIVEVLPFDAIQSAPPPFQQLQHKKELALQDDMILHVDPPPFSDDMILHVEPPRSERGPAQRPPPYSERPKGIRYRCPSCQGVRPRETEGMTTFGIVMCVVLLLTCLPTGVLAWLFIERYHVCCACGTRMETYTDD